MNILTKAKEILTQLNKHGESYIVGGSVRDIQLGITPHDIDIATNVPMNIIEDMFDSFDIGKNKDFGIVVIKYKGSEFEIAQFRTDGDYSDGRRPDHVNFVEDIEVDLSRRDLTINAMAMDIDGNIIDPFNGQEDILLNVIKTVGNPYKRFEEDHLRMIRCLRFAAVFNFTLDPITEHAIKTIGYKITDIAVERVVQEIKKVCSFGGPSLAKFINLMNINNILPFILPEISAMNYCEHSPEDHPEGNVFSHTMRMLEMTSITDFTTLLSILFHDVGKINSHEFKEVHGKMKHTYHLHHKNGVEIFENTSNRLKLDNETSEAVKFCIFSHMKFLRFNDMRDSKIHTLANNKNFDLLFEVSKLDNMSQGVNIFKPNYYDEILERVEKVKEKYSKKTLVSGNKVMELTGLKPGPEIGKIISKTTEFIINAGLSPDDDISIDRFIIDYSALL